MKIKTPNKRTRTFTIFVEHGIMAHTPLLAKPMKTLELHYPKILFARAIII